MQLSEIVRRPLFGTLIGFASLVSGCASAASPLAAKKTECLMVRDAMISTDAVSDSASPKAALDKANYGHQIKSGKTYVASIRVYEDDGSGADAAIFQKVTLELQDQTLDEISKSSRDLTVRKGFLTKGGVGFIHKGEYWRSIEYPKSIRLHSAAEGMTLTLSGVLSAKKESDQTTQQVALNISCPIRLVRVGDLNPWTGKVGTDWNSFAPQN